MNDWPFDDLPRGEFRAILADPPWRFVTWSASGRDRCPDAPVSRRRQIRARHYHTMSFDEILSLPVAELAAKDCVLFLWVIDPMIPRGLQLGAAWGFTFKTVGFYWAKERLTRADDSRKKIKPRPFPMGTGYWTRANPETCLLFTRGKPKRLSRGVEKLIVSPRREHSRKPDETCERIQALVGGPYCELFSRQTRAGWSAWGDEAGKYDRSAA